MFNHLPRDMAMFAQVLTKLDVTSLAAQRRLTIPFVREVLDEYFSPQEKFEL
jgi:chromosomal replication initiation ATPase DnaA